LFTAVHYLLVYIPTYGGLLTISLYSFVTSTATPNRLLATPPEVGSMQARNFGVAGACELGIGVFDLAYFNRVFGAYGYINIFFRFYRYELRYFNTFG
jgi:hypothetical protein